MLNTGFVNRNVTINPRYKLSGFSIKFSNLHVNSKISADRCKQILANKFADVGRLSKRFVTSLNQSWRNPNTINPGFTND